MRRACIHENAAVAQDGRSFVRMGLRWPQETLDAFQASDSVHYYEACEREHTNDVVSSRKLARIEDWLHACMHIHIRLTNFNLSNLVWLTPRHRESDDLCTGSLVCIRDTTCVSLACLWLFDLRQFLRTLECLQRKHFACLLARVGCCVEVGGALAKRSQCARQCVGFTWTNKPAAGATQPFGSKSRMRRGRTVNKCAFAL